MVDVGSLALEGLQQVKQAAMNLNGKDCLGGKGTEQTAMVSVRSSRASGLKINNRLLISFST